LALWGLHFNTPFFRLLKRNFASFDLSGRGSDGKNFTRRFFFVFAQKGQLSLERSGKIKINFQSSRPENLSTSNLYIIRSTFGGIGEKLLINVKFQKNRLKFRI